MTANYRCRAPRDGSLRYPRCGSHRASPRHHLSHLPLHHRHDRRARRRRRRANPIAPRAPGVQPTTVATTTENSCARIMAGARHDSDTIPTHWRAHAAQRSCSRAFPRVTLPLRRRRRSSSLSLRSSRRRRRLISLCAPPPLVASRRAVEPARTQIQHRTIPHQRARRVKPKEKQTYRHHQSSPKSEARSHLPPIAARLTPAPTLQPRASSHPWTSRLHRSSCHSRETSSLHHQ